MEGLGGNWKVMMPVEEGFFVYCRELGRGEDKLRVGTAMMTDVGGDRRLDTLYMMIPVKPEQARTIERAFLVTNSTERIIEIGIDKESQDQIEYKK